MMRFIFALSVFVIGLSGMFWADSVMRPEPPAKAVNLDAWVNSLSAPKFAQRIEARSDETVQLAQPEGREPGPEGMRPRSIHEQ